MSDKIKLNKSRPQNITEAILQRVEGFKAPKVFFASDFNDVCSTEYARKTLSFAEQNGKIERLAPGIYSKSVKTKFGPLRPSLYEIAEAIAVRDKVEIMPTGAAALNILGLSTQVPTKVNYLITGSPRTVKVGGGEICFIRSVPRNFAYKSKLMAMLIQALRIIGKGNVTNEEMSALYKLIQSNPAEAQLIKKDTPLAPAWMQKILKEITEKRHGTLATT
jgi:hypothetical protein